MEISHTPAMPDNASAKAAVDDWSARTAIAELERLVAAIAPERHEDACNVVDMFREQVESLFVIQGGEVAADGTPISPVTLYASARFVELLAALRLLATDLN